MTEKTMTEKILCAISDALHQECPDRAAPESALITAISLKVANVICEDYNRKILETNQRLLDIANTLAGKQ